MNIMWLLPNECNFYFKKITTDPNASYLVSSFYLFIRINNYMYYAARFRSEKCLFMHSTTETDVAMHDSTIYQHTTDINAAAANECLAHSQLCKRTCIAWSARNVAVNCFMLLIVIILLAISSTFLRKRT